MGNVRPNQQRAKTAMILIWIVLGLEVVSFISAYFQLDLLQYAKDGGYISMDTANANDAREQIIAIIYLIAYIASGVTFIMWFRRAYYNLHQKYDLLSQTEGWAAGCWFVPIVSLYRPFQIMKEMHTVTRELLVGKEISLTKDLRTSYLGWWWALWIISGVLGQIVFRFSWHAENISDVTLSTIAGMIGNILGVPLALITIKIIKDYSDVEPLLSEIVDEEKSLTPTAIIE
ncbi:MAG: DUF4328 domain-containing protein [Bacteroidota bacterium]